MARSSGTRSKTTRHILDDNAPAFLGVRRALVSRIGTEWKVGDRLPPISDLARNMRVGQNNAQRAVKELVAEGVLFSRRRLGVFVRQLPAEYQPASPRDPLLPLKGKTLGMYCSSRPVPFLQRMMDGFSRVIRDAGGQVTAVPFENSPDMLPELPGLWGMVIFNPNSTLQAPPGKQNFALVSTAGHINVDLISRFDSVSVDQYQGGALAGKHLRELGCKDACFIGRRVPSEKDRRFDLTSSARLNGFECGWGDHLLHANLIHVPGYSMQSGAVAFERYAKLSPRPVGVFAATDELAIGFLHAAASAGLKPDRDFFIVGFDGQDREMPDEIKDVRLSTVRVPAMEMGRRVAQLVLQREADPTRPVQRLLLTCSLSTPKPD